MLVLLAMLLMLLSSRVVLLLVTSKHCDNVAEEARKAGFRPIGVEGERDAEWILIDLGFVVVHVMLPTARKFYDLESLWRTAPESVA